MYLMKDACEKADISYETLKYYCNQGLIPHVKRDKNNYRMFDDNDIAWINGLSCLKKCGMGISEMKEYVRLCLEGEASIPERKVILDRKRENLLHKLEEINECINYIDAKQKYYDGVLKK